MDTLIFNIDSRNRNTTNFPSETNFSYTLSRYVKNITSVSISSLEYGNTSYLIDSAKGNNTFTITYSGTDYVFTADNGNYSPIQLVTKINEYTAANVSQITSAVDTNTGKITFTSDGLAFSMTFNTIDTYSSLGQLLGFKDTSYSSSSLKIVSDNVVNLIGENYYFLKINDLGKIYNNGKRYFCKIILDSTKFEVVYESRSKYVTKEVEFLQPINLKKLDIKVEDTFGNVVTQNGIDFSFTIEFKVIRNDQLKKYKSSNFYSNELIKIMLYDKMLKYFDEKLKNKVTNNNGGLTTTYHKLLKNNV
jgi:hypothetical protein